jgi:hypothetical protein
MRTRLCSSLPGGILVLLVLAGAVRAAVTCALAPAPEVTERGAELLFHGTLTNTSATEKAFLNDITASFDAPSTPYLSLKPNAFFANVPGILAQGESYNGPIFRIAISRLAPVGDYAGAITLRGGSDEFATNDLVTVNFGVASPLAGVTASGPIASEFGPRNGAFTVARTGSTNTALTLPITTSGSAVNGVTYQTIAPSITIAAAASSAPIVIAPIADTIAQGDRAAIVTLGASAGYALGANSSATVTVRDLPIDEWRIEKFGVAANTPAATDLADAESDGVRNLLEYALDADPFAPWVAMLPTVERVGDYLQLSYVPKASAPDVNYVVEASDQVGSWSAAEIEPVTVPNNAPPERVTVRYKNPVSLTSRIFLRLSVQRQ